MKETEESSNNNQRHKNLENPNRTNNQNKDLDIMLLLGWGMFLQGQRPHVSSSLMLLGGSGNFGDLESPPVIGDMFLKEITGSSPSLTPQHLTPASWPWNEHCL